MVVIPAIAGMDHDVSKYRDIQAFADRAHGYHDGLLGQVHRDIVARTIELALSLGPAPRRVLDVGCGTGLLLRELGRRLPEAPELTGVDPAAAMIETASAGGDAAIEPGRATDTRPRYLHGRAERLPFDDASFDLVISTTSFDHWADQGAGLAECHRVLVPGGRLVLTDLFSLALLPTLFGPRSDRARTQLRATKLLAAAGFRSVVWHRLYAEMWLSGIFRAVTASA
jgi:ubiquinone/menaquinone biosynthesis C-methylase UbiE